MNCASHRVHRGGHSLLEVQKLLKARTLATPLLEVLLWSVLRTNKLGLGVDCFEELLDLQVRVHLLTRSYDTTLSLPGDSGFVGVCLKAACSGLVLILGRACSGSRHQRTKWER